MKVAIVGLGIAGLRTAMLLEAAGAEVLLFEAKGRPGGRLHAVDEGGGVLYEAGGEWIDADHSRTLALLGEFGIELDGRGQWPRKLIYKGRETTEDLIWNEALEDDLRVEAAARDLCRGLKSPPWANTQAAELDKRRLADFLREHTRSERGLWWVGARVRSDEGDDPEEIGLLGWLVGYLKVLDREGDEMSAYRISGGSRRLCEKMLASLRAEPTFGATLTRVRQSGAGVRLTFEQGQAEVDRVVLTLPPPCLEAVVFDPPLGAAKRCAIEATRMSRAVKISWQFDRFWWREAGWGGGMLCDGPLQQTWEASLGEAPVLTAYVCGRDAVEWLSLGDPVRAGLYELSVLFPEASRSFERGWFHDWVRDPFSRGAFSHLAPGYVLDHMAHIAHPEGPVHFAGEHTATWTGFIEGAIESAERVAAEVLI